MDSNRIAWLAGVTDADGCIGLYTAGKVGWLERGEDRRVVPKVAITTTCRKTRDRVQEVLKSLGIGVYVVPHNPPKETGWADRWDLLVSGMKRVAALLPHLLPHLVTKEQEAILTLQFIQSRFGGPQKKPYTSEERDLVAAVRALKRNRNNS